MLTLEDYQWLFRKSPTMATSIAEDGTYLDVNDAFLERLGFDRDEMIGRRTEDFVTPESAVRIAEEFRPALRRTRRLRQKPVSFIAKSGDIVDCLKPYWHTTHVTAQRTRARIANVFDYAIAHGWRDRANPAAVSVIKQAMGRVKREKRHHAAIAWKDLPSLMRKLEALNDPAARALRLAIYAAARTDEAIGMRWSTRTLPCFTVWRNTPAEVDGYVLGIEPGTNYPNPHPFEKQQGRVIKLAVGQKWSAAVSVAWHRDAAAIAADEQAIRGIQGERKTIVSDHPRPNWSSSV